MINRILLIAVIFSLSIFQGFSQEPWCGFDSYNQEMFDQMSLEEQKKAEKDRTRIFDYARVSHSKSGTVYTIPTVIHVVHDDCDGNISMEQIQDGMRILNEDFRRINSDTANTRAIFKGLATDAEIQFVLARIDPNGNCTEGVNRVNSPLSNNASPRNAVKGTGYWNSNKYFNIWLVNSIEGGTGTILGYAQFPYWGSNATYGLVCRHDEWGNIQSASGASANGRVPSHEVGHCLGLYHTFQDGCGNNCSNSGDDICDTPPTQAATWSCSKTQNTCSNDANGTGSPFTSNVVDQVENYMSYDLACQNMFTKMQVDQMRAVITQVGRLVSVTSASNLVATGTNPGYAVQECKPISDYCQEVVNICEGNTVTYTDRSYNGDISTRNWSFPGGSPATSSDSIVTVSYNTSGKYNMSLTVANSKGSNVKSSTGIINVLSQQADFIQWRYDENFEDNKHFSDYWTVNNPGGGRQWELTTDAAYTGNQSIYLYNYINSMSDIIDEMITPAYDLSAIITPKLFFQVAYARKSSLSTDVLRIHYSYTCGESWNILSVRNAMALESVSGFKSQKFVPADQSEWKEIDINISSFISSKTNVRFKFEFVSGLGNNIYIDDINITSTTGISEEDQSNSLLVYPNPVSGVLTIDFAETNINSGNIEIKDLSGRTVYTQSVEGRSKNGSLLKVDVSNLTSGIYFLNFRGENGITLVKKIAVH